MKLETDEPWYWIREISQDVHDLAASSLADTLTATLTGAVAALLGAYVLARVDRGARRKEREDDTAERYNARLDDALVRLFQLIGEHLPLLYEWDKDAQEVELHSRQDSRGNLLYAEDPGTHDLIAHTNAIRLIARSEDREVTEALGHAMVVLDRISGRIRATALLTFMDALRAWRSGEMSSEKVESAFRKFETDHKYPPVGEGGIDPKSRKKGRHGRTNLFGRLLQFLRLQ